MIYSEPLFRPPSEAYSFILQITHGCSWNKCAFCEMYTSKEFRVRRFEDIRKDILEIRDKGYDIRKIFLADGNPLVLSTKKLLPIIAELNNAFPKIRRISTYALTSDILRKSRSELSELKHAGLSLLYVGIESGNDEVLKMINKSESKESTINGLNLSKEVGIDSSVMILLGLGGKKYSLQHAVDSAQVLNETQPKFASTLVLNYPRGFEHFKSRINEEFTPLNMPELLNELKVFIEHTELENTIFRSDHASNYLVLKGNLGRDKERFLKEINFSINNPELANLRPEWLRGL